MHLLRPRRLARSYLVRLFHSQPSSGLRRRTLASILFTLSTIARSDDGSTVTSVTSPPRLIAVNKIWQTAGHSAFTDLIRYKDRWFCVFREGSGHIPGTNGTVRVLSSDDAKTWKSVASIRETGIDLRGALFGICPDGRLMLIIGGSI